MTMPPLPDASTAPTTVIGCPDASLDPLATTFEDWTWPTDPEAPSTLAATSDSPSLYDGDPVDPFAMPAPARPISRVRPPAAVPDTEPWRVVVASPTGREPGPDLPGGQVGPTECGLRVLWVPRCVAAGHGPNGGTGPGRRRRTLTGRQVLIYLALLDESSNKDGRLTVDATRTALRAGVAPPTVRTVLYVLRDAGLLRFERESAPGVPPIVVMRSGTGRDRVQLPVAAVWPTRRPARTSGVAPDGPRWGKDSAPAVVVLLALLLATDWQTWEPVTQMADRLASRADLDVGEFHRGVAVLVGPGAKPGTPLAGRGARTTAGLPWLSVEQRTRPSKRKHGGPGGGPLRVMDLSRYTWRWGALAPQPAAIESAAFPETDAECSVFPDTESAGFPETESAASPETESLVFPQDYSSSSSSPFQVLLSSGTSSSSVDGALRGRTEEEDPTGSERRKAPVRHLATVRDAGNGKGAEDVDQRAGTVSLRRDLAQAASKAEADALLTAAVERAGGRNHLGEDDQLALIHANVRWAPERKLFVLGPLEQADLDVELVPLLGPSGHDPLLVAQALTRKDNKVRSPVGALIARLDVLGGGTLIGSDAAHPSVVWVEHQPEPLTGGRAVDKTFTPEDYAQPL